MAGTREGVGMPVTMGDVAELAGVSQRTVSNVVRGYVHVRPETRARVQRAIEQLKYRPNPTARSLREGRTGIIGLAVPEIAAPYFAEIADHVQQVAASKGITLLIDQTGADPERELLVLQGYDTHVIDGLIFSPMGITLDDLRAHEPTMPTVLLGERIHEGGLLNVAVDNVAAAAEATRHLLAGGRRRIVAVGADLTTNNVGAAVGRLQGYEHAHREAGLEPVPELALWTGGWARAAGYAAVDALIDRGTAFDALFCFNDLLAIGGLKALQDRGLHVPRDVAVVGWDDIEEVSYSRPSLTSISPDKAAIAQAAVSGLLAQIAGEPVPVGELTCEYRLVVRESSAAVPER